MIQNGDKTRWAVASIFALAALAPGAVCAADPDAKTVLRLANELTQPFLEQVSEMVSIDSPTYYVPGIEKMEAVVRRRMAEFGAGKIEVIPVTVGTGNNVIARWNGTGKGKILLMAHYDTVHKEGVASARPFRVDEGRAYGPGILDDKGGIVLALNTIRLLQRIGFREFGQITLLSNPDEERGSFGSRDLIRQLAKEHDTAFVLEFGTPEDTITHWRKGAAYFKLEVKGKTAHAGAEPEKGCNALVEMAHQVLQLGELGNKEKETTINFTILKVGDRYNIIPDEAFAQADVRILFTDELDRLEADYKRLSQSKLLPCATVQPIVERGRPPFPPNRATDALVAKALEFYREIGLKLNVEGSGGATDGNYSASVGTTTLDAMGPVGGGAHTLDEYIDIDRIGPRIYLLARLIMDAARNAGK